MYVRVTRFENKPEKIEDARALSQRLVPEIRQIPGLKEFINAEHGDGKGITIALYGSKAEADAALPRAKQFWGQFKDMWASPPVTEEYEVGIYEVIG